MSNQGKGSHVLLSRMGGICLLLLGVHSAADFFNRTAFRLIDSMDLVIDQLGWALLHKLGSLSVLNATTAESAAESLARWVDISEKEFLAGLIGVGVELGCVVFLADFAWGHRPRPPAPEEPKEAIKNPRYRAVFRSPEVPSEPEPEPSRFRLEAVAVIFTLGAFTMSGLCFLAVAVENLLFRIFEPYPSLNRYIVPAGAGLGILLGVACLARFLPEMLIGAYRKSLVRILRGAGSKAEDTESSNRFIQYLPRYLFCETRRGGFVMVALLPLGILSLLASVQLNVAAIWASLGSMP